jgi:O-antigen/teichoic acid export membrane protein
VQGLVNLKKDKIFLGINVAGAIISIIANMLLANAFQHIGTSIAWVISETGITIGFILVYRRLKINLFDWAELKRLTHPGYFLSGK